MSQCRYCVANENMVAIDGKPFDFYTCDECQSTMCHNCTHTSIKTGIDVCWFCLQNLKWNGKWK